MLNNINKIGTSFLVICFAMFTLHSSSSYAYCGMEDLDKLNIDALKECGYEGVSWSGLDGQPISTCLKTKHQVSQQCSGCLSDVAVCAYNQCTGVRAACGVLGSSLNTPECEKCLEDKCGRTFQECAGISITLLRRHLEL